jgi:predicted ferric reductase
MTATDTRARARRAARHQWWADGLEAAIYLAAAIAVAFVIAGGGFLIYQPIDWLYAFGRVFGVIASVFVLAQVLLVSRAPYIERSVGHDRTVALHTRLGKWAIILMLAHAGLIVGVSSVYDGNSLTGQLVEYFTQAWYLATAQIALAVFLVILATSLAIVRRRWRYESWHAVHLLVYVAVALAVPHQFLFGATFVTKGAAWWYWLALYVFAFGSLILFRMVRPVLLANRHRLRVDSVTTLRDGSTSIVLTGRNVLTLRATPGQFFLWRFLARGFWTQAHPFSLSRTPDASSLRITVKPSGDFSSKVAQLAPGTRVLVEGPLGVFHDGRRASGGSVLVAAGIGITPIRAMLDAVEPGAGPVDVIVRCSSEDEAPLLDEVRGLAAERGAKLHVIAGSRGAGWSSAASPASLVSIVPDVPERDVFVCGPRAWALAVEADALAAGVPKRNVHREEFSW